MHTSQIKKDEANILCLSRKTLQILKDQFQDIFAEIEELFQKNEVQFSFGTLICEIIKNTIELPKKMILSHPLNKKDSFSFLPVYGIHKYDINIYVLACPSYVDRKESKYRSVGVCPALKNQVVSFKNRSDYSIFIIEVVFSKLVKFDRSDIFQKLVETGQFCNFAATILNSDESNVDYFTVEFPFSDISLLSVLPVLCNLIEYEYPQSLLQINIGCR